MPNITGRAAIDAMTFSILKHHLSGDFHRERKAECVTLAHQLGSLLHKWIPDPSERDEIIEEVRQTARGYER